MLKKVNIKQAKVKLKGKSKGNHFVEFPDHPINSKSVTQGNSFAPQNYETP